MHRGNQPISDFSRHRPSSRHTLIVTILACLLIVIALTVVPWIYYVGQGKRAVADSMDALREAGYLLTLEELHAHYHDPSLNSEENAAPVYEEAFARMQDAGDATEAIGRLRDSLLMPSDEEEIPEEIAIELAALLDSFAEALVIFEQAANLPFARFDMDLTEGFVLLIPHVGQMRQGVRLLGLQAIQQATQGEMEAAASSIDRMLAIAAHLQSEPTLIAQLTGVAMIGITLESLEWILARYTFPLATLEQLDLSLYRHEISARIPVGMAAEIPFANAIFATPLADLFTDWKEGISGEGPWPYVFHRLSGRIHRDQAFYLQVMKERLKLMNEPLETWAAYSDRHWESAIQDKPYLFSNLLLPTGENLLRTEVHIVARLRINRLVLALERHRHEEGRLPEKLEDLVPRFLPELPKDPVHGNPFLVQEEEEWLILESAARRRQGPDREDQPVHGKIRK